MPLIEQPAQMVSGIQHGAKGTEGLVTVERVDAEGPASVDNW
jgi:hypothetical protein